MKIMDKVLEFWFGDKDDDVSVAKQKGRVWFGKDDNFDRDIKERFGALVEELGGTTFSPCASLSARERLAKIIVLDQFPRNIFRGTDRAFAFDSRALALSLAGLERQQDQELRFIERTFFYLPLEHSEELEHQELSVALFRQLANAVPEAGKKTFAGFLDFAIRHREIIARFGRFPHRNQILGRPSTLEETDFLTQPGSSF